jgi:hypothetical protein
MASSSSGLIPISAISDDVFSISNNNTWSGQFGIVVESAGPSGNMVTENAVHNCGQAGILSINQPSTVINIMSNVFGECGLSDSGDQVDNAVILVNGFGADASGATTFIQNNTYSGHMNGLQSNVTCQFINPHIPAANVTGDMATQVLLTNHI